MKVFLAELMGKAPKTQKTEDVEGSEVARDAKDAHDLEDLQDAEYSADAEAMRTCHGMAPHAS